MFHVGQWYEMINGDRVQVTRVWEDEFGGTPNVDYINPMGPRSEAPRSSSLGIFERYVVGPCDGPVLRCYICGKVQSADEYSEGASCPECGEGFLESDFVDG